MFSKRPKPIYLQYLKKSTGEKSKEKKKVFKNTFGVLGPGRGIKQLFYNM